MSNKSLWDYIRSKNHIIPSPLGNKLGIPVLRTILANLIIKFRRLKNCKPNNDYENKLIEDGALSRDVLDGVKKVDLERQKQNTEVGEGGDKKDLESGEVKEV